MKLKLRGESFPCKLRVNVLLVILYATQTCLASSVNQSLHSDRSKLASVNGTADPVGQNYSWTQSRKRVECNRGESCSPSQASNKSEEPTKLKPAGLVTRTTDAIYKALSGVFSYGQSSDRIETDAEIEATTLPYEIIKLPDKKITTTTTSPKPTTVSSKTQMTTRKVANSSLGGRDSSKPIKTTLKPHIHPENRHNKTSTSRPLNPQTIEPHRRDEPQVNASSAISSASPTYSGGYTNVTQASSDMYNMLNKALQALLSIKESILLNRNTRLAPEHEQDESSSINIPSAKLLQSKPLATSEDVHLLCKLLHKHLENTPNGTDQTVVTPIANLVSVLTRGTTAANSTTTTTTQAPSITSSPKQTTTVEATTRIVDESSTKQSKLLELVVNKLDDLNETQEAYLLESVFKLNKSRESTGEVEMNAKHFIESLFNTAAKNLRARSKLSTTTLASDYELDVGDTADAENGFSTPSTLETKNYNQLEVRQWQNSSKTFDDHLHFAYWLLERQSISGRGYKNKYRIVQLNEAQSLMDKLEHFYIQRLSDSSKVKPILLLSASRREPQNHNHEPEAFAIDDRLVETPAGKVEKNGLQLLFEKLSDSSFVDNLHLYLIIFILVLFTIILCFAFPLICCKARVSNKRKDANSMGRNLEPKRPRGDTGNYNSEVEQDNKTSDSIWRKLSTSTTTLVKDQESQLKVRNDGTFDLPIVNDKREIGSISQSLALEKTREDPISGGKRSQFEWYSFEEREEARGPDRNKGDPVGKTHYIIRDKRQMSKSVQSYESQPDASLMSKPEDLLSMDIDDYKERRVGSSDTLTKSELVMIKEKLVPIGRRQERTRQVASQTSIEKRGSSGDEPDYVNQPRNKTSLTTRGSQTSVDRVARSPVDRSEVDSIRHMDSVAESSRGTFNGSSRDVERRPKMRHLDLPPKTRGQVEAIRSELNKVEQRDFNSASLSSRRSKHEPGGSSYQRYDVV